MPASLRLIPTTPSRFRQRWCPACCDSWSYDGVLITDDFSMGAAYASKEGVAGASIAALNAGVDLILIAYDPAQYFPMLDAVLVADGDGRLNAAALSSSLRRLAAAREGRQ
jgi:beta-N-acetylhexosaminidase